MNRRLNKLLVTLAAIGALGVGGAAFAAAHQAGTGSLKTEHQHKVHKHPRTATASRQTGEQAGSGAQQGGENVQEGDQSAPDTGSSGEQSTEGDGQASPEGDSAQHSDGPGGHADQPGANVDHQFEGQE